jgi:thiol-disulfide isomerase/thioredoxin
MSVVLRGGDKKKEAEKILKSRPILVLFFMDGCGHCESNKPAWEEAKKKAGMKTVEIEASAVPDSAGVSGFPTMQLKDSNGTKEISGEKQSGDQILSELGVKKGGRRKTRGRKTRKLRRTLRNYLKF